MPALYRRKSAEVLVNTETLNTQSSANLALLPGGGFVVVWIDNSMVGTDTDGFGIKAQRFDADGNKLGAEFLINTTITGNQTAPVVATLASGRFVVTWVDASATGGDTSGVAVRGQIFEANGTPVGGEFLINTETANNQGPATVVELSGGGFLVSWSDGSGVGGDTSGTGIKAQLFDSAGAKVGGEFLVNTVTTGSQGSSSLIGLAGGGFAVAWQGAAVFGPGTFTGSIRLQLFDAAGAKVGTEQVVNTQDGGNFNAPNITALTSGFIVTWGKQDTTFGVGVPVTFDVHAQLFDASGVKVGGEFTVNTTTEGTQQAPDVDSVPGGGFLVTWQGEDPATGDFNIYGQFFDAAGAKVGAEFVVSQANGNNQVGAKVDVLPNGDIVVIWTDSSGVSGDASSSGIKMVILTPSTEAPTDIGLTNTDITEVAIENLAIATLSAVNNGGLNSAFTYEIVSDSSGGAFRIEGDQLIVNDNAKLDFETGPEVDLRIRVTDLNGTTYEEDFTITLRDVASESRYAAGDEFRVNNDTLGFNTAIGMTALASGGFAVVTDWFEIGVGSGRRLHIFDGNGTPAGAELDLDLDDRGGSGISLAGLSGGGFVIAYEGNSISIPGGGNGFPIRVQRFDSAGNEVGADLIVSQTNGGILTNPEVTTLSNGGFVVTWQLPIHEDGGDGGQIMARLYAPAGVALGNEFRANTGIANSQAKPEVAALPGGGFVVAWEEFEAGVVRVEGQIFDASGAKLGGELLLTSLSLTGDHDFSEFKLTALASGSVLVSWVQRFLQDVVDVYEIKARLLAPDGTMGAPFHLVTATLGPLHEIAALPDGGFVLTADTFDHFDPAFEDMQSFGLIFDPSGQRVGDGFPLPESSAEDEIGPFVVALGSGDIAFTWTRGFIEGDSATSDTYARILTLEDGPINGTSGPDNLVGTAGDDEINGLAGNDVINGLGGADTMRGGAGDDSYIVDNAGDVATEAVGGGYDTVYTLVSYALTAGSEIEVLTVYDRDTTAAINLTGNAFAQTIYGNQGSNTLIGEGGADIFYGLGGDDRYLVDSTTDQVFEASGGGYDTVYTFGDFALNNFSSVEALTVYDRDTVNAVVLFGNNLDNVIYGNQGDNALYGGGGTDTFYGLGGNDSYVVDGNGDQVFELDGQGYDTVYSTGDFALNNFSSVEALSVYDRDTTNALTLFGNDIDNVIYGNQGSNALLGGGGEDTFYGLGGDDRYFVDSLGDQVIEVAGGGDDTVYTTLGSYSLITDQSVETLTVYDRDTTNAVNLTGNNLAQLIYGNAGTNNIDGKGGADTLYGMGGADIFTFTAAPITGAADILADFSADDTIALDDVAFLGIGSPGALNPNAFVIGSAAQDADDRIVYNQATGQLYFDADGNGAGAAVLFATLNPGTILTASDFTVI